MDNNNLVKSGVNAVMGVKAARDTTVPTDLENPQWDQTATLQYVGATIAQTAALTGLQIGRAHV